MSRSAGTPVAESHDSPSSPPPPPPPPAPTMAASRLFMSPPSSTAAEFRSPESIPSPPPGPDAPSWSTSEQTSPPPVAAYEPSAIPSTGDLKISKAGLRTAIGSGFKQGCRLLSVFIATQPERDHDVWEPDEEDVQGVARPAANIVHRRLPDEAKGGDAVDFISLGLALVGYVAKNLHRRSVVRSVMALQEAQGEPQEAGAGL